MRPPPFSLSSRVEASTAKVDRFALEIGDWRVRGDENEVANMFHFLGPRPESLEAEAEIAANVATELTDEMFGWMFHRPHGRGNFINRLPLREPVHNRSDRNGRPLASGYLNIKWLPTSEGEAARRLRLQLSMNATRFVYYDRYSPGEDRSQWETPVMRADLSRQRFFQERVFGATDNVLRSDLALHAGRPEVWGFQMERYLVGFEQAFDRELLRAYRQTALQFSRPINPRDYGVLRLPDDKFYNLDEVETYWEFWSENACGLVRTLSPPLMQLGRNCISRGYPTGFAEEGTEGNSPTLRIVLRGGRMLRVYAKTDRRIRFEIVHDLRKPQLCRLLEPGEMVKTTPQRTTLLRWFTRLAEDAARELNRVLQSLENESQTDIENASISDLVGDIARALPEGDLTRSVLQMLLANGRIVSDDGNAQFLAAIKRLRRVGILRHSHGVDRVTRRYASALRQLIRASGEF